MGNCKWNRGLVTYAFPIYSWLGIFLICMYTRFMMTSSSGNIFRVIGLLCGEFTGHRWMSHTKASDAVLWCFFYLCLNKRLSKHSWDWRFETPALSLWRYCNLAKLLPWPPIWWATYDKNRICWNHILVIYVGDKPHPHNIPDWYCRISPFL